MLKDQSSIIVVVLLYEVATVSHHISLGEYVESKCVYVCKPWKPQLTIEVHALRVRHLQTPPSE